MQALQRFQIHLLGREIGTASGWDEIDTLIVAYYDFHPIADAGLPACGLLTIYYNLGAITVDEVEGLNQQSFKIIDIIRNLSHT